MCAPPQLPGGEYALKLVFAAFLLLVGAPAALLVLGRAISRATDFERRRNMVAAPSVETGEAWYYRKMRPAFQQMEESGAE